MAEGDAPTWRSPERTWTLDSGGLELALMEWGDPHGPPVVLTHGTGDSGRTFDALAPRLATGGWRVVAWDQRGHGDSARAVLYSWEADLRDLAVVVDRLASGPIPLVGHSKGGMLVTMLADAWPHRVSHVVNLDGFASHLAWWVEVDDESCRFRAGRAIQWLDRAQRPDRPGAPLGLLVARRQRQHPRLPRSWIEHLTAVSAQPCSGGWRWKLDPGLDPSVFQVIRQEWPLHGLPGLAMPLLVVLGLQKEEFPMDQTPATLRPFLPDHAVVAALPEAGHFLHVEQPDRVAQLILDFLGPTPAACPAGAAPP